MSNDTLYLLFDGSSPDGRGRADYIGRTTDAKVARKHFDKCKNDFYSTGKVIAVTDTEHKLMFIDSDWEKA